jgi:hypothetical protein
MNGQICFSTALALIGFAFARHGIRMISSDIEGAWHGMVEVDHSRRTPNRSIYHAVPGSCYFLVLGGMVVMTCFKTICSELSRVFKTGCL